jgi:hypothetical protein
MFNFDEEYHRSRNLYANIILRGVRDYVMNKDSARKYSRKIFDDANYWIYLDKGPNTDGYINFDTACFYADIDSGRARRVIKNLTKNDLKKLRSNKEKELHELFG